MERGFIGRDSALTSFFTAAAGSQNVGQVRGSLKLRPDFPASVSAVTAISYGDMAWFQITV